MLGPCRYVNSQLCQLSLALSGIAKSSNSFPEVKAGMTPAPGGRYHCVIPYGM